MDFNSIDCPDDWLLDYGFLDDISVEFLPPDLPTLGFSWPSDPHDCDRNISAEVDYSLINSEGLNEVGSQKRLKPDSLPSGSKASREKLRRDRLNERFQELCSILEPGRPPKSDKAAILSDAARMVTQLRNEAQRMRETIENLQVHIKELKIEKSELRDEKQRLKAEKDKLEHQVKALTAHPGFLPHPNRIGGAIPPQGQCPTNKSMPFVSYQGTAMWRFMSPAVVDTSQDHVLRPPVA